jgi:hypothetical protein
MSRMFSDSLANGSNRAAKTTAKNNGGGLKLSCVEVRKLIRVGNSLSVTVPKDMLTYLKLMESDLVILTITNNRLEITKFIKANNSENKREDN